MSLEAELHQLRHGTGALDTDLLLEPQLHTLQDWLLPINFASVTVFVHEAILPFCETTNSDSNTTFWFQEDQAERASRQLGTWPGGLIWMSGTR